MTRSTFRMCALALAATFALASCTGKAPRTDALVVGIEAEPERLDPLTIKNPKTFLIAWQIYEGLLSLDKSGEVAPGLADQWSTTDNLVWRFHIRSGARFQDSDLFGPDHKGRSVTAGDVVASYTAFCSARAYPAFLLTDTLDGCAAYNGGKATSVSGLRAVGNDVVEMRLIKPERFFLNRLTTAWIAIFPQEALAPANRDRWGLGLAVGTGPFRMVSHSASQIVMERNPDYWDQTKSGTVKQLTFRTITNDEVRLGELRRGGIDMMLVPNGLLPAVFTKQGGLQPELATSFRQQSFATFNSNMIGFNLAKLPDVHLRRAISLGIDRRQIVDQLFLGHAEVAGGPVPPGMSGYHSQISAAQLYNPKRAAAELAQSGYHGEPIELLIHNQAASEQIGQLVQAQLKPLGIAVVLKKVDFDSAIGRMVKGDDPAFSMFLDYVFSSPEPILANLFDSAKRPAPNFWQFSNPAIDADLHKLGSMDRASALHESARIEAAIMTQAPAAFLFRLDQVALYSNRFGPVSINPHGAFDFRTLAAAKPGEH